ncbi:n-acetylglucosamine-1-phosphodiester alpha-N-acetylglucosaminidase-like exopolysaccharide biosynthesis protein [Clostridium sp. CAG:729]|nr:n-acetylglucosamine-1-phosphodiester alpha-N-acetylglucosaminidase-like exopolysaccharide biosynthesis protein [Clostridium sp. CAG:729]
MDTLILHEKFDYQKLIETTINVSIIGVLILCQGLVPIHAGNAKIAQVTAPDFDTGQLKEKILNEISPEVRQRNFEEKIRQKYPKAAIYDVTSGVKHIKLTKYYAGKPVRINVVEVDMKLAKDLELTPALSSDTTLQSRRTITTIAKNKNAVVALNGTYFKPQTGVPLGTLMINKKMYTGPIYDRVAMGIFDNGFDIARVQLNASVSGSGKTIPVNNINQPRMLSTYVLVYTSEWGKYSPYAPKYGMGLQVVEGKITKASANPIEIPQNGYVISGPKSVLQPLLDKKDAELIINTNPEWKNVKHIISGGPYLVRNSEVFVDMTAQKLGAIGGRNPRSAIGYTADNNLILVAVDGREGSSIGMTLMELASFMQSIGCTNAMNLDGGGSTVMYVNGQVVNKPQMKGGIPLSNAIVLSKTTKS